MGKLYTIRLQRIGRWKKPVYQIIVTFDKIKVSGKYFEKLGFYSPASSSKFFFINLDRLSAWLLRGAVLSRRFHTLLGKAMYLKRYNNNVKY